MWVDIPDLLIKLSFYEHREDKAYISTAILLHYMGFVVDKVALGQVFLPVLRFSPLSIIPPMLHTH